MKLNRLSILIAASFYLTACGASPLLNHTNADGKQSPLTADAACPLKFSNSGLCAKIDWIVGPDGSNEDSFRLSFWNKETGDSSGPYVNSGHDVAVQLWMPSMGHGSSPVTVAAESTGIYRATRVFFTMPGAWEIRVRLQDGGTLVEQAIQAVNIQ